MRESEREREREETIEKNRQSGARRELQARPLLLQLRFFADFSRHSQQCALLFPPELERTTSCLEWVGERSDLRARR